MTITGCGSPPDLPMGIGLPADPGARLQAG
jgi:hypothetical protein